MEIVTHGNRFYIEETDKVEYIINAPEEHFVIGFFTHDNVLKLKEKAIDNDGQ